MIVHCDTILFMTMAYFSGSPYFAIFFYVNPSV